MTKVIIFGGGVAGLTAAHELLTRGIEVELYEKSSQVGGLAETQWFQQEVGGQKITLPGEHGFRLFPSFYRHVGDSMKRTPVRPGSDKTIADCLRPTRTQGVAFEGDKLQSIRFERTMPRSSESVSRSIVRALFQMRLDPGDMYRFQMKMVQYMTSCSERRLSEYEKVSWWEYLEGDRYTPRFQRYLNSVPRTLVAMDAKRSDGRTQSNVLIQHMLDHLSAGSSVDRVLDGPTSARWIEPWTRYLRELGATITTGVPLLRFNTDGRGAITGAVIKTAMGEAEVKADYYVAALPIRALQKIISRANAEEDAVRCTHGNLSLLKLLDYPLDRALAPLSGVQYYLEHDVSILPGHVFLPDSAWGLSLVSQAQFWGDDFRRKWGGGKYAGIISVDVANFDDPFELIDAAGNKVTRTARSASEDEFARGVWQQIQNSFDAPESVQNEPMQVFDNDYLELREWKLPKAMPPYHLDALLPQVGGDGAEVLINPPGSWDLRAGPAGRYGVHLGKLVVAGTYMQTFTGLPTMESANESARHAVNAILESLHHPGERCTIWPIEGAEPRDLDNLKDLDQELFSRGEPHFMEILGIDRLISSMMPAGASLADGELSRLVERFYPAGLTVDAEAVRRTRAKRSRPFDPLSDQLAALGQLFRMGVR